MSDEGRRVAREGCAGDGAAYALGALEPAEAEAFERHLEGCEECAEDLAGFAHVVDALAMSAPQHAMPSGLRRRVMRSVRSQPARSRASHRRWRWAPLAVGLASAVLAIAMLASRGSSQVRIVNAGVGDSPGSAQVRLADGRAELIVRNFPAPAAGHTYEVWLKKGSSALEPTRVLFSGSARGARDIEVPAALRGVDEILVTEEPAGGSLTPTSQPVIVGRLS